jgi:iron complex transport system substrate-binding protein
MFDRSLAGRAVAALLPLLLVAGLALGCGESSKPSASASSNGDRPSRIVSLSATATETLYAIGAGPQVHAVDDQSNHPPRAPRTELSALQPNAEAVAARRPDLVVTTGDDRGFVATLRKLGVAVLVQPPAQTLDEAYAQIVRLGTLTGHEPAARRLVAGMRERIAALVERARPARGASVYHELTPDVFSATSKTFIGSVYALFGLRNIADRAKGAGSGYPQLSREHVLRADPDLIVLADVKCCDQSAETLARRPGWARLSALRDGDVLAVDDDIASRWGPRTVAFAATVAAAVRRLER